MHAGGVVKYIFVILLFIFSCEKVTIRKAVNLLSLESQINERWQYAISYKKILKQTGYVTQPLGSYALLLELKVPKNSYLHVHDCVYYKVPFKEISGELVIEEKNDDSKCDLDPSENAKIRISNVEKFKFETYKNQLIFDLMLNGVTHQLKFLMINLEEERIYQDYRPLLKKNHLSFLTYLKNIDSGGREHLLGKYGDRYSSDTSIACLKMNDQCEIVGENICDSCRYGHFEVIKHKCKTGPRFCGINRCGEKDEPACLRGQKSMLDDIDGICSGDLEPKIDDQKILICN